MTARKQVSLLSGKKARVTVERNGACITVEEIDAAEAGLVLADILTVFRVLRASFPELIEDLQPVGGYSPLEVTDDPWAEDQHRVGFRSVHVTEPRR